MGLALEEWMGFGKIRGGGSREGIGFTGNSEAEVHILCAGTER